MHDPETIERNLEALIADVDAANRQCETRRNVFIVICFAASMLIGFVLHFTQGIAPGKVIIPAIAISVLAAHLTFRHRRLTLEEVKKAAGDTETDNKDGDRESVP